MRSWPSALTPLQSLLVELQFVGANLGEVRRKPFRRDILDARRRPGRIAVLVDHGRAYALAKIVAAEDLQRGTIFAHEALLQARRGSRQPQKFERHHHAARR